MKIDADVIIIGGGLAGLTSAIHLLKYHKKIIVLEKNEFPQHKVCGEFISNEVLSYFTYLNINIDELQPVKINRLKLVLESNESLQQELSLGGFGISRYGLDNFLAKMVSQNGGDIIIDEVQDIIYKYEYFNVTTISNKTYSSKLVFGCFGKRSNLDKVLNRNFFFKKSHWLGVKYHAKGKYQDDEVGLYTFDGGYCGVSKVENNTLNICYLVNLSSFKKYNDIENFEKNILFKNKELETIISSSTKLFAKPKTISQISFDYKPKVENHILMLGDAAGMIHPLCGNGMAMAIHSAKIASTLTLDFLNNTISRKQLENYYAIQWNKSFNKRLKTGVFLSKILLNKFWSRFLLKLIVTFPKLLNLLIKRTHGKPF